MTPERLHDVMERLAALEHDRWSGWMNWLYKNGTWNADGSFTIRADKAQRWARLAQTYYADLDESTKEADRVEVRKTLAALEERP